MSTNIDISKTKVCYELPNSKDTTVFGPAFWDAFDDLAGRVPCDGCREHAKEFVSFWHDLVNLRTGKPLYDKSNFNKWMTQVNAIQKQRQDNVNRKILIAVAIVVVATFIITLIKVTK